MEEVASYSLALLYGFYFLGNLLSSRITQKLGNRLSLLWGGTGYVAFIFSLIFPSFCTAECLSSGWRPFIVAGILLTSAMCGITGALLWMGQGCYLTECSSESLRGFYSGLFWCIFTSSQIVGNFAGALIIDVFGQTMFFVVMTFVCAFGVALFSFLTPPTSSSATAAGKNTPEPPPSYREMFLGMWEMSKTRPMLCSLPLMLLSGVVISTYVSVFPSLVDDVTGSSSKLLGFVFLGLGFGEMFGGLVMGKLADRVGIKKVIFLAVGFVFVATSMSAIAHSLNAYGLFFVASFAWGIADSGIQCMSIALPGVLFSDRTANAFALLRLAQAAASTGGFLFWPRISSRYFILLFNCALGTVTAVCASKLDLKPKVVSAYRRLDSKTAMMFGDEFDPNEQEGDVELEASEHALTKHSISIRKRSMSASSGI
eukprot:GILK01004439.1.p1 GENE.GILK01004439.1~~GILK01004439.1.p1  ORF type:complete len:498 (+),score=74.16 GILK01004439.1:212-1495(+)